jgi:hypothetical protein
MGTTQSADSADVQHDDELVVEVMQELDEFDTAQQLCTTLARARGAASGAPSSRAWRDAGRRHQDSEMAGILASGSPDLQLDTIYEQAHAMAAYAHGFGRCEAFEARVAALGRLQQSLAAAPQLPKASTGGENCGEGATVSTGEGQIMVAARTGPAAAGESESELGAAALVAGVEVLFGLARDLQPVAPHALANALRLLGGAFAGMPPCALAARSARREQGGLLGGAAQKTRGLLQDFARAPTGDSAASLALVLAAAPRFRFRSRSRCHTRTHTRTLLLRSRALLCPPLPSSALARRGHRQRRVVAPGRRRVSAPPAGPRASAPPGRAARQRLHRARGALNH